MKKRITGLSSRRLFVQFNWRYIWKTGTFTEVTKLFKLFSFFLTIIVSRSWGHLSLFLSSFTNNTTKTANARDISTFTRHILHSKNTRADWLSAAVFVVRSSATFWPRSRRLEGTHQLSFVATSWGQCGAFEPKHASLETELSLTVTRVDAAVSHAFRFIQLLRIKHAVTQEREAVPLLLPFSFTSFLSSIRFGNRQIRSFKWSLRRWNVHTYKSVCTFSQPVSPESRTL